jgi:hypothetical protein
LLTEKVARLRRLLSEKRAYSSEIKLQNHSIRQSNDSKLSLLILIQSEIMRNDSTKAFFVRKSFDLSRRSGTKRTRLNQTKEPERNKPLQRGTTNV